MGMANKCENCAEKCPQAEMAHNAALGRMYATNEFLHLLKKVESGELVEVVRCKNCRDCEMGYPEKRLDREATQAWLCKRYKMYRKPDDFCSYGERRHDE